MYILKILLLSLLKIIHKFSLGACWCSEKKSRSYFFLGNLQEFFEYLPGVVHRNVLGILFRNHPRIPGEIAFRIAGFQMKLMLDSVKQLLKDFLEKTPFKVFTRIPSGVPPGIKVHQELILDFNLENSRRISFEINPTIPSGIPTRVASEIPTGMLSRLFSEIPSETLSNIPAGGISSQEFIHGIFPGNVKVLIQKFFCGFCWILFFNFNWNFFFRFQCRNTF